MYPFISAAVSRPRMSRAAIVSAAIHASLLGLFLAPLQPARYTSPPRAAGERVQFANVALAYHGHARHPRVRDHSPHKSVPPSHKEALPPAPFELAVDLPDQIAAPDVATERLVDSLWLPGAIGGLASGVPASAKVDVDATDASTEVYVAAKVETAAVPLPENPKPEYPRDLLRRSIETSFIVFFVVDTTGRIDKGTIEVPPSVQEQFASAVRTVMVRWHFLPAQRGGRRVRQFMEQPFSFRIVDEGRWNGRAGLRSVSSPE
jgi:TonB family protein